MKQFVYKDKDLQFGYIEDNKFILLEEYVTSCVIKGNFASIVKADTNFIEFRINSNNDIEVVHLAMGL